MMQLTLVRLRKVLTAGRQVAVQLLLLHVRGMLRLKLWLRVLKSDVLLRLIGILLLVVKGGSRLMAGLRYIVGRMTGV